MNKEGDNTMDWDKIKRAYEAVESGLAKRLDVDSGSGVSVIVYSVGDNVVRIDFKKHKY